jgi:hypothetical protein
MKRAQKKYGVMKHKNYQSTNIKVIKLSRIWDDE